MPVGNIPGWRQVLADGFNGSTLNTNLWRRYGGQPGGDPGGWWDPSHVSVSNGTLTISGYRDPDDGGKWTTGGITSVPGLVQTYGKYLVRLRLDAGIGIAHALVLFPADNRWPPEVDFSEDSGNGRSTTQATVHYGRDDEMLSKIIGVDLTRWHTLGVEWTPGRLRFTLDGGVWFQTVREVPIVPMALAIQTQAWPCIGTWGRCPDATTPRAVNMYVDWVAAYAPAGRGRWSPTHRGG